MLQWSVDTVLCRLTNDLLTLSFMNRSAIVVPTFSLLHFAQGHFSKWMIELGNEPLTIWIVDGTHWTTVRSLWAMSNSWVTTPHTHDGTLFKHKQKTSSCLIWHQDHIKSKCSASLTILKMDQKSNNKTGFVPILVLVSTCEWFPSKVKLSGAQLELSYWRSVGVGTASIL